MRPEMEAVALRVVADEAGSNWILLVGSDDQVHIVSAMGDAWCEDDELEFYDGPQAMGWGDDPRSWGWDLACLNAYLEEEVSND